MLSKIVAFLNEDRRKTIEAVGSAVCAEWWGC